MLKKIIGKFCSNNKIEKEREKKIFLNSLTAILAQLINIASPLITVKYTLNYLGVEIYGLWMVATAFFSLMAYADLGLGSGAQSELCRTINNVKEQKKIISSSYFILLLVSILFIISVCVIFPILNWNDILNFKSNDKFSFYIIMMIAIPKLIGIPAGLIKRVQNALQIGHVSNLWQVGSSILNLVAIIIVTKFDLGKIWVILIPNLSPVIIDIINFYIFFYIKEKEIKPCLKMINLSISKYLIKIGLLHFILSLIITLSFNIDNYIIAKISSLEQVTSYSICLRITQLMNVAIVVLSQPLWSANGEALENGDINWVKKITKKISNISALICFFSSIVLIISYKKLFFIWLGKDLKVDYIVIIGMLVMQIILAYVSPYFMVLNGAKKIKIQILLFLIYTPISIFLKIYIGEKIGIDYIPIVGALSYLFLILIPTVIIVKKLLKKFEEKRIIYDIG